MRRGVDSADTSQLPKEKNLHGQFQYFQITQPGSSTNTVEAAKVPREAAKVPTEAAKVPIEAAKVPIEEDFLFLFLFSVYMRGGGEQTLVRPQPGHVQRCCVIPYVRLSLHRSQLF